MPTPTKRTRTPKTPPATPAAVSDHRTPELSETHEVIIDAVSDMLAHGGREDDIDNLINATMSHANFRELGELFSGKPESLQETIDKRIENGMAGWKTDLSLSWRKNKRPQRPEFEPKTISDRVRARARDVLIDRFEEFLQEAKPEEIRLLGAIFHAREGGSFGAVEGVEEIPLGEAFAFELDRNDTYIRIPKGFRARVQKYVDALQAIEDRAA